MKIRKHDWLEERWRPAMGWMYMVVCIADFIVFPMMWSVAQMYNHAGQITNQWNPLTLQGAGLFHMAMGAVLGVAAWSRGQEKLAGVAQNYSGTQYSYRPPVYPSDNQVFQPTGAIFVSKYGKRGPIIEEPLL